MIRGAYGSLLDAAHAVAVARGVVVGPGGYAYATADLLLTVAGDAEPIAQPVTERAGISCVRFPGHPGDSAIPEVFGRCLLGAHVDLLEDVLAVAVDDLGHRSSAGTPLLSRQLVQAGIADAAMLIEEVRGLLELTGLSGGVRPLTFRRLVRGGRALLRLLGGASYLADGPGGAVMAAELVGTLYLGGDPG